MTEFRNFDGVLILGAGLAGLSAALAAAPRPVLVVAPASIGEACASAWAQGGMAAALGADDTPELHAADTIAAGAGLCDAEAVRILTCEGADAVRWLAAAGAPFDRGPDGDFLRSLEAAHSRARVARVGGDGAGAAIMRALAKAVAAHPHIEVIDNGRARALLQAEEGQVVGALIETSAGLIAIQAAATVLATGGVGGLYQVTTNPPGARGEGLGLAILAGAEVRDLEFVQFHPTAMNLGRDPAPLASEAIRGEGARLIDETGRAFMATAHPLGDLAPRDVVARAIQSEINAGHRVFLDPRQAIGVHFNEAFPAAFAACMAEGLDPRRDPIPVAPAAHYHMGGVKVDGAGQTSLQRLFAIGECSATGAHGANRLASNSLLEAVVWGRRAGAATREAPFTPIADLDDTPWPDLPVAALKRLRARMTRDAGVVRDGAGLARLSDYITELQYRHGAAPALIAAGAIVAASRERRESLGAHWRSDFASAEAA